MTLDIYRFIFFILGLFCFLSNGIYLLKKEGLTLARKQHQELPYGLPERNFKVKVTAMFLFGILFLATGVVSLISTNIYAAIAPIIFGIFATYGVAEALYYRYWKTFGFMFVCILLFIPLLVF
jgi:hypothetical protein